jgi:tetratricopeptide (TPR) repeat protein
MNQAYTTGPIRIRIGTPAPPPVAQPRPAPAFDDASVGPIVAALDAGDLDRAARLSEQAVGSGLRHPTPLCVMAMAHELGGRFADAIPLLMRALELAPKDASMMVALARCLLGLDRPGEALVVLEAALELAPSYANAHAHKGQALGRLSWMAEEEQSYARALALDPTNLIAKAGMASLCSHFGEHQAARAHAQAVLGSAPDHTDAALVVAMADIAEGSPTTAEVRVRRLLAAPKSGPWLPSFLGDALDAQDRAQEAFDAYARTGEALHRLHEGQYARDDVLEAAETTARLLQRLPTDRWPRDRAERPEPAGVDTHVFLLGFARTGTSLLGLALEGDEQVEVLQERELLTGALKHFAGPEGLGRLLTATEAELADLRTAYWLRARAAGATLERKVFVDKQPMNTVNLPVIARLFPGAKILVARRDPRDVVLSCFRQRFLMNRYTYHLLTVEGAARLYDAAMQVADSMERLAPLDALAVRHEDLVEDFDREMGRVCGFLGIGWSEAMRSFSDRVRSRGVATPSAAQLTRGLNSNGVGQWRRYARQLEPMASYLLPWIDRFGYEHPMPKRDLAQEFVVPAVWVGIEDHAAVRPHIG